MKSRKWLIFQLIQFMIFVAMEAFLMVRSTDGARAAQTYDIWFFNLAKFYIGLLAGEWIAFLTRQCRKK